MCVLYSYASPSRFILLCNIRHTDHAQVIKMRRNLHEIHARSFTTATVHALHFFSKLERTLGCVPST